MTLNFGRLVVCSELVILLRVIEPSAAKGPPATRTALAVAFFEEITWDCLTIIKIIHCVSVPMPPLTTCYKAAEPFNHDVNSVSTSIKKLEALSISLESSWLSLSSDKNLNSLSRDKVQDEWLICFLWCRSIWHHERCYITFGMLDSIQGMLWCIAI